ncbi:hypothetical protein B0H13DRAFT_2349387 [Mycena leptocephala]|nr:hypothetical protein B0H13DRAFT_2349387 [Mycena leptocephala]
MRPRASPSSEFSENASNLSGPASLGDLGGGAFSHERRRPDVKGSLACERCTSEGDATYSLPRARKLAGLPLFPWRLSHRPHLSHNESNALTFSMSPHDSPRSTRRVYLLLYPNALRRDRLFLIWAVIFPVQQCFHLASRRLQLEPSSASPLLSSSSIGPVHNHPHVDHLTSSPLLPTTAHCKPDLRFAPRCARDPTSLTWCATYVMAGYSVASSLGLGRANLLANKCFSMRSAYALSIAPLTSIDPSVNDGNPANRRITQHVRSGSGPSLTPYATALVLPTSSNPPVAHYYEHRTRQDYILASYFVQSNDVSNFINASNTIQRYLLLLNTPSDPPVHWDGLVPP